MNQFNKDIIAALSSDKDITLAVRIEIGQLQKRLIILRKSTISEVNIIVKT